jgi:predicted PurR-regulated permease PerM
LTVIASVLAIAALYYGRSVFIPLASALVLGFLLTPFVSILEKIHLGRVPSVTIAMILALALAGMGTWGVAGQLVEIMAHLPDYKENLDAKIEDLHRSNTSNFSKATASVQELNKELSAVPGQVSGQAQARNQGTAHPVKPIPVQVAPPTTNLVQDLSALLGPLSGPLETAVIVIIFAMFMLIKREDLRNRAIRLAGRGKLSLMTQAFDDASRRLSRFLLLQFLVNAGYGALFGLGLYLIHMPHALLWGMVAAFFRFVPYVGTFVAAALPLAMAIAVFPGWREAGLTFGLFTVLELVVANAVEPMLYGSHTGISSLAILVAAVFWTTLWGPVGLILSTPLTVCLVVLGGHVPQLKFLEVMLGDEPALPIEQHFYQRLLAADVEEAREIAEEHLKENSLQSLYESVFIPALRLSEQDYQIDAVDDDARRLLFRSTHTLIEDLGAELEEKQPREQRSLSKEAENGDYRTQELPKLAANIACIPVRSGPDDLVATMLVQLFQRSGYQARELKALSPEETLGGLEESESSIVCVSSLPPLAISQVRTLCRKLQARDPGQQVILGVWGFEGGAERVRERLGGGCPGHIVTTFADALEEIRRAAEASISPETVAEPKNA